MKKNVCAALLLLVCLIVPACQQKHEGASSPVISVVDLSGSPSRLSFASAPVTAINLWATWCVPCKTEIKNLIELHDEFTARGCSIIGVALDSIQPDRLKPPVAAMGIPYPVYAGDADDILRETGVSAIPATLFIDRTGTIVKRLVGYHTKEELRLALDGVLTAAAHGKVP